MTFDIAIWKPDTLLLTTDVKKTWSKLCSRNLMYRLWSDMINNDYPVATTDGLSCWDATDFMLNNATSTPLDDKAKLLYGFVASGGYVMIGDDKYLNTSGLIGRFIRSGDVPREVTDYLIDTDLSIRLKRHITIK